MFIKKIVASLLVSMSFVSNSWCSQAFQEPEQSRVPSLLQFAANALVATIGDEARETRFETFNRACSRCGPRLVQQMTNVSPYYLRLPLSGRMMGCLVSVDLSHQAQFYQCLQLNPNFFFDLSQGRYLRSLNLYGNHLGEYLKELKYLTQLTSLNIRYNGLGTTVRHLQSLTNLMALDVSYNGLGANLSCLQPLSNLRDLNVSHNQHTRHLRVLQTLTNLTRLDVRDTDHAKFSFLFQNNLPLDENFSKIRIDVSELQPLIERGVIIFY